MTDVAIGRMSDKELAKWERFIARFNASRAKAGV